MTYDLIEDLGDDFSPLEAAKALWRSGDPVPVDLATTLMQYGYDVPALEARYSL